MDNNISSILETDRKARQRLAKARKEALESREKLESNIEKYKEKRKLQAQKDIAEVKETEERKIKAAVEQNQKTNKKICKNLDTLYEENKKSWVNEIVKRCLEN